jgi:putative ABC transport system permease protein
MHRDVTFVAPRSSIAWHLPFVIRFPLRDLRGGLRGFRVFLACTALGVAAIAAVGSFAQSVADGLAREGRVILGGDVAFSVIHREATPAEQAFMTHRGRVSVAATMRAMARASNGRSALVEIKAVDDNYPLYGAVVLDPGLALSSTFALRDEVFGAAADPALLARLDLSPGAQIIIGDARIEIRATLRSEPDKLAAGIAFGPRLLVSAAALRASGLVQPGSLVRWHYRLRLADSDATDRAAEAVVAAARSAFPDAGWEIRTRANASPELGRNIARFTQFLTLIGLAALLVGGVGVANAIKSHLDRKRDVIATIKALGATGAWIFSVYLVQVLVIALTGAVVGILIGASAPFLIAALFQAAIPLPLAPAVHPRALALALVYGLLTAMVFALWPLGRARDIATSALFRDEVAPQRRLPRWRYLVATAIAAAVLAAVAVALADDRRLAAIFLVAAGAAFIALPLISVLLMTLMRRLPRPRSTLLRLVIANIHRPGALTPTVVLSLGLGLVLLVTLALVEGNLRRQFTAALPDHAPSFYFVDIQGGDAERFDNFVHTRAPSARLERVPMLRGRIVSANGINAENLHPPANAAWVLQGDRGITYASELPAGSRLIAGKWWGADYRGPPLVSLENRIAEGLGLKLGDRLVVNVLGRNIAATIANLRVVDWQTLGINFVLVFSPGSLRGAPHAYIATLTYADGGTADAEIAMLKAVADAFPTVTAVRVKEVIEAVSTVVLNLALAVRGASAVSLIAAVLVLGGALATSHRHRLYDAVVLKTLGATRGRLLAAYALEYALLGLATALVGVAAGSIAAFLVVSELMNLPFVWLPVPALITALAALALTLALGLIGTFAALGQKPAPVLRHF